MFRWITSSMAGMEHSRGTSSGITSCVTGELPTRSYFRNSRSVAPARACVAVHQTYSNRFCFISSAISGRFAKRRMSLRIVWADLAGRDAIDLSIRTNARLWFDLLMAKQFAYPLVLNPSFLAVALD